MPFARRSSSTAVFTALFAALVLASAAQAAAPSTVIKQERVPGGALEQTWLPGFNVGRTFTPLVLSPGDPAIPSPTGDNTVAVLTNVDVNLGGIAEAVTDAGGFADYTWEADFFTGAGNTRRGLVLRAQPGADNSYQSFYQFVINAGLFVVRFRKFVNGSPVVPDLASWNAIPPLFTGPPAQNTWHHMRVDATANSFNCYFDGVKLNAAPIVDSTAPVFLGGAVGAYNFSATVGEVPVYFDNLTLLNPFATAARTTTWGRVKSLYR